MAVTHSISGPPLDLDLMKSWREPLTSRRLLRAGIGSVIVHIAVAAFFILMPEQSFDRVAPIIVTNLRRPVKLYLPPDLQLTQRDPNQGQPAKMVDVHSMHVSPRPQMANSRPSPPPGAPAPAPVTPPAPQPVRVAGIELPKIETPKIDVPAAPPALSAAAPKSDSKPTERPKIAFEDVTPGQRASQNAQILPRPLPPPTQAAQESLRNPPQPAGASGAGTVASSNAASQELREMSPPQLLSDPRGVDFKPYMIQVLSVVRRNWLAILPESARAGRRGRVIIQFAIDRTGAVPKVVIAEGTGTDALDRAAVAAISASVPLPPLPADYKGDKISLQFAFSYNMPAR